MSKVLAKFQVTHTERMPRHEVPHAGGESKLVGHAVRVTLGAVPDDMWGPHTPHGELTMTIHNEATAKVFEDRVGQEFMLEFTPADEHPMNQVGEPDPERVAAMGAADGFHDEDGGGSGPVEDGADEDDGRL